MQFKTKTVAKDKEGHYIRIKRSIQKEDITVENIYTRNIQTAQYIRQMLTGIQGEIHSSTLIIMDLKIPPTWMDRSSRQKVKKKKKSFNCNYPVYNFENSSGII